MDRLLSYTFRRPFFVSGCYPYPTTLFNPVCVHCSPEPRAIYMPSSSARFSDRVDILRDVLAFFLISYLILRPEGVSGDLSLISGKKGQGTFRVTAMAPPMNIRGGAPFVFNNRSAVMEFSISTIISMKLSSSKSYGGCIRNPQILSSIDISDNPCDYSKCGYIRLSHQ